MSGLARGSQSVHSMQPPQGTETPNNQLYRLIAEMEEFPAYRGWSFTYEYPGYFCYSHDALPYRVFFTPDWGAEEVLPIEVQDWDGGYFEEYSTLLPLPREERSGEKLLNLVRPTLDKLLTAATPLFETAL